MNGLPQRLHGKVAVVTGGARGIGAAIVERLAREGARVCIADLLVADAKALVAEHTAAGRDVTSIEVDLADVAAIGDMIDRVVHWGDGLDILANNAGVALPNSILAASSEEWEVQVAVNLRAPFFATQAAARHMVERGSGKIVNTVSTSGFTASTSPSPIYDLTKGGIRQMTISTAAELAPLGINVNGVAPGTIGTELTRAVLDTPEKMARSTAKIPMGVLGKPADIAAAVAYLSSSDADYVHGHVLVVDGGWLTV